MYLNKKSSAEVAGIINSMIVSREVWFDSVDEFMDDKCDYEKVQFWKREYHKDVVRLSEFGIKLHNLEESLREVGDK